MAQALGQRSLHQLPSLSWLMHPFNQFPVSSSQLVMLRRSLGISSLLLHTLWYNSFLCIQLATWYTFMQYVCPVMPNHPMLSRACS